MNVTRRGGKVETETIVGWLSEGCSLMVLDKPPEDKRRGFAYVTDGDVPAIILREEAQQLIAARIVRPVGHRGPWDVYRANDLRKVRRVG